MQFHANTSEKLIKSLIHNVQGLSFGSAQKALRMGKVKVNNKRTKENIEIVPGDIVEIYGFNTSIPQVPIIYEDHNILIVGKPAGIECATRDKSSDNTYSLEEIFKDKAAGGQLIQGGCPLRIDQQRRKGLGADGDQVIALQQPGIAVLFRGGYGIKIGIQLFQHVQQISTGIRRRPLASGYSTGIYFKKRNLSR